MSSNLKPNIRQSKSAGQGHNADPAGERIPLVPSSPTAQRSAVGFDLRTLMRITRLAFEHRWRIWLALLATALAALSQIYIPQLIGRAVDQAVALLEQSKSDSDATGDALMATALLLFGASVFRGLCTMVQNYQGEAVGHLLAHELRLQLYTKLQRLSFSFHDAMHTGELMTRGILDIEGTRLWVHTGILRVVLLSIMIFGGGAMLASTDPWLAVLALGFVPFVGFGASWSRLRLRTLWLRLQEELGVLTRIMEDNLGGIRVVRAFANETFEIKRFDVISDRALAVARRRIKVFVSSTTTMTFVFFLSMGLVLWIGGERVINGHITVGELAACLAFMTILQQPIRQIAWMVNSIARASTCGGRLFEIIDLEPSVRDRPDAQPLKIGDGVLRFENVSFEYATNSPDVAEPQAGKRAPLAALDNIEFELAPGQVLGIVGPPGSGKSTLVHLIPRFYDPSAGRITIGGEDIREVTLDSLRQHVSLVQQDAFLFTTAIDANVAYGDPWADRSAVRQSTETAQLYNYISQLPEGFATLVGERGVSLSGGQRQRLAIARAVLPQAGILVFDDATAAVDAGTEQSIRRALRERAQGRATIIIAHRLSSLMHADEILFLDAGRVVERGNHRDLLAAGGRYAELYALQVREQAAVAGLDKAKDPGEVQP